MVVGRHGSGRAGCGRGVGFGLIELLVVVAIVAILASLAMPSYRQTMQSNRVSTEANDLLTAIDMARGEAVTRSRFVSICPANAAATACGGTTDWGNGWIVFADDYANTGVLDGDDTVLRVWDKAHAQDAITAKVAGAAASGLGYISFDRMGRPQTAAGPAEITFEIQPRSCAAGKQLKRVLTVKTMGYSKVSQDACS